MIIHCPKCQQQIEVSGTDTGEEIICQSCASPLTSASDLKTVIPPSTKSQIHDFEADTYVPKSTSDDEDTVKPGQLSLETGELFGDYRLEGEIARGGMGVVYKARQISLNRPVAMKMILRADLAGPDALRRFRDEAKAAAKLDHPGIVPVYEVGEHLGQPYFSMGYIEGLSLSSLVSEGPLPNTRVAELIRDIAQAVHFAHSRNIVHRDLKPSNVLLDQDGTPKVTDFGLAKNIDEDSGLTSTGVIMGTPGYMAPEQAAGKVDEVGPLADVYALGGILYFLLTGQPPFHGNTPIETVQQVLAKPPESPQKLNPNADTDLSTICLRCLSKEQTRRYSSAQELAEDLQRWLDKKPILARPVGTGEQLGLWIRRQPLIAALLFLLVTSLMGGFAVSAYYYLDARENAVELIAALGEQKRLVDEKTGLLTEKERLVEDLQSANTTIREDAQRTKRLLYLSQMREAQQAWETGDLPLVHKLLDQQIPAEGEEDLRGIDWNYLWNLSHQHDVELEFPLETRTDPFLEIVYSRTAPLFARFSKDKLAVHDMATGRVLREKNHGFSDHARLSSSPDGQYFCCSCNRTLVIYEWETLNEVTRLSEDARFQNGIWRTEFSPAKPELAIGTASGGLLLLDYEKKDLRLLVPNITTTQLRYTPDGQSLIGLYRNGLTIWDTETGDQQERIELENIRFNSFDLSPNGKLLALGYYEPDAKVAIWDRESGQLLHEFEGHGLNRVTSVQFSPDGKWIVSGAANPNWKLWSVSEKILERDQPFTQQITKVGFSHDGSQLFTAGPTKLYLWNDWQRASLNEATELNGLIPLAVSQEGRYCVGRNNTQAVLFDRKTGERRVIPDFLFPERIQNILGTAEFFDERLFVIGKKKACVFSLKPLEKQFEITHQDQTVFGVSAAANSPLLVSCGSDG